MSLRHSDGMNNRCQHDILYFILQSSPDEALELAMKHGDIQALEKALETHANVNKRVKDERGTECTILHMAARVGNGEAIKMILKVKSSSEQVTQEEQVIFSFKLQAKQYFQVC